MHQREKLDAGVEQHVCIQQALFAHYDLAAAET